MCYDEIGEMISCSVGGTVSYVNSNQYELSPCTIITNICAR